MALAIEASNKPVARLAKVAAFFTVVQGHVQLPDVTCAVRLIGIISSVALYRYIILYICLSRDLSPPLTYLMVLFR